MQLVRVMQLCEYVTIMSMTIARENLPKWKRKVKALLGKGNFPGCPVIRLFGADPSMIDGAPLSVSFPPGPLVSLRPGLIRPSEINGGCPLRGPSNGHLHPNQFVRFTTGREAARFFHAVVADDPHRSRCIKSVHSLAFCRIVTDAVGAQSGTRSGPAPICRIPCRNVVVAYAACCCKEM